MSTAAKRPRMDKKGKTDKRNYYAKAFAGGDSRKKFLEPGQCGFMVTCNFREKDCIQESYRLLNECADELYGKVEDVQEKKPAAERDDEEEEEEVDISVQVQNQAEAAKKQRPQFRFQSVETGAKNCCFITTTLKDPKELALKILRELNETKKRKSRNILRLMPIEVVTRANLKDIIDASGALFDKYFLKEPKTFAIIFNKRFNNSIERTEVIEELGGLIASKNIHNKANLKNPDLAIIVEVVKGLCLISVVPEYFKLRKYNMVEICAQRDEGSKEAGAAAEKKEEDQATESSDVQGNEESEEKVDEAKEVPEDEEAKAATTNEDHASEVKKDEKQEEDKQEDVPVPAME